LKIPKYICAKCRLPFTRRWNANRHCNNKHDGALENIISYTEYVTNQNDYSSTIINYSYEDNVKVFIDKSTIYPNNNNLPSSTLTDPLRRP
jgi:hypothetical protein